MAQKDEELVDQLLKITDSVGRVVKVEETFSGIRVTTLAWDPNTIRLLAEDPKNPIETHYPIIKVSNYQERYERWIAACKEWFFDNILESETLTELERAALEMHSLKLFLSHYEDCGTCIRDSGGDADYESWPCAVLQDLGKFCKPPMPLMEESV